MSEDLPKTGPNPADDPGNDREDGSAEMVAYLDGELDPASAAAVESKISLDPAARAEAESLKRTWELLDYLPMPDPSPNFTSRTLSSADLKGIVKQGVAAGARTGQLGPERTIASAATPVSAETAPRNLARRGLVLAVCWVFAIGAAFVGGYLIRDRYIKQVEDEKRTQINAEKRLLNHIPRYRFIESKANLATLDDPELFGEEP